MAAPACPELELELEEGGEAAVMAAAKAAAAAAEVGGGARGHFGVGVRHYFSTVEER